MSRTATPPSPPPAGASPWEPFPEIDLRQLLRLTDDTGVFQHAIYAIPDPNHGYCIDDNARALIAALLRARLRGHDERVLPMHRYLGFLTYAFNEERGRFRNFMGYDRHWLEEEGSLDSQGRAIWALGTAVASAPDNHVKELAEDLFRKAMPAARTFEPIRSRAFALLGLSELLTLHPDDHEARSLRDMHGEALLDAYLAHATEAWPWWEDRVTYDNAQLCHALLLSGQAMQREDMIGAALTALRWLLHVQTAEAGHLTIIGNRGWLEKNGERAQFDQQPLEAHALVDACLDAAHITGEPGWADAAWWAFEWFRGRNDLGAALYHPETGGCQDGLQPNGPNKNQGAESVLAYLLSVLRLSEHRESNLGRVTVGEPATLGLGVIGAGGFARFCLDYEAGVSGLHPAAVWSRTFQRAQTLARDYELTAHESLESMLADPHVQIVHVASPPGLHAQHAFAALQAGKHVLCEKPLALDAVEAQRLIQTAAERDRWLGVNFMMRYGPLAEPMRRLIEEAPLGRLLRLELINAASDAELPPDHWFWDETISGGIFIEHAVHFFDLFRAWLGEAQLLSAYHLRRPESTLIDQVACDLRFNEQTTVTMYHGFHQTPADEHQQATLVFEHGWARLTGWIFDALELQAAVSEATLERIEHCLPDCTVETLERFGSGATQRGRNREASVDRKVRVTWRHDADKGATHGHALRQLISDGLATIRHRWHRPRVTAEDGRAAVALAVEAHRLARNMTP